jgi:hypothetical protein
MKWLELLASPINGVINIFNAKQERKKNRESALAKINLQKEQGKQQIELSDAEWEAISANKLGDSWKDEYVTILITSPFLLIILGAIQNAFGFGTELIDSAKFILTTMKELEMDFTFLLEVVVLAALGLKIWRRS